MVSEVGCRDVQWILRRIGYSVEVNGTMDDKTVRCIRFFQRDMRLPDTGVVDDETRTKLSCCYANRSSNEKQT